MQLAVVTGPYWDGSLVQPTLHVMSHKTCFTHKSCVDLYSYNYSTIDTLEGLEVPLFINITIYSKDVEMAS